MHAESLWSVTGEIVRPTEFLQRRLQTRLLEVYSIGVVRLGLPELLVLAGLGLMVVPLLIALRAKPLGPLPYRCGVWVGIEAIVFGTLDADYGSSRYRRMLRRRWAGGSLEDQGRRRPPVAGMVGRRHRGGRPDHRRGPADGPARIGPVRRQYHVADQLHVLPQEMAVPDSRELAGEWKLGRSKPGSGTREPWTPTFHRSPNPGDGRLGLSMKALTPSRSSTCPPTRQRSPWSKRSRRSRGWNGRTHSERGSPRTRRLIRSAISRGTSPLPGAPVRVWRR